MQCVIDELTWMGGSAKKREFIRQIIRKSRKHLRDEKNKSYLCTALKTATRLVCDPVDCSETIVLKNQYREAIRSGGRRQYGCGPLPSRSPAQHQERALQSNPRLDRMPLAFEHANAAHCSKTAVVPYGQQLPNDLVGCTKKGELVLVCVLVCMPMAMRKKLGTEGLTTITTRACDTYEVHSPLLSQIRPALDDERVKTILHHHGISHVEILNLHTTRQRGSAQRNKPTIESLLQEPPGTFLVITSASGHCVALLNNEDGTRTLVDPMRGAFYAATPGSYKELGVGDVDTAHRVVWHSVAEHSHTPSSDSPAPTEPRDAKQALRKRKRYAERVPSPPSPVQTGMKSKKRRLEEAWTTKRRYQHKLDKMDSRKAATERVIEKLQRVLRKLSKKRSRLVTKITENDSAICAIANWSPREAPGS